MAGTAAVLQQVTVIAQVQDGGSDHVLAQCVDGRVRHLGEQLVEVVEKRARFGGEAGERGVDAHGGERHLARQGHGAHDLIDVIPVVAELGGLDGRQHICLVGVCIAARLVRDVRKGEHLLGNPVAERLELGKARAKLVVVDHARLGEIDLEHLARAEQPGGEDVGGVDLDGSNLGG